MIKVIMNYIQKINNKRNKDLLSIKNNKNNKYLSNNKMIKIIMIYFQ